MPQTSQTLEPTILVIFGITGDLSQRYLLPSLYHLLKEGQLPEKTVILGVSRRQSDTKELFAQLETTLTASDEELDPAALLVMRERTFMHQMDLEKPDVYDGLLARLNQFETEAGVCMNRLYYLSIPPKAYEPVVRLLGERGLNASCPHGRAATRLLVEKPFGYDLGSAQKLIEQTARSFQEEQIFRIDHYMAKETVQNILTFRFKNPIFEALWNSQHISAIRISQTEEQGVAGRGTFYDPLGALRDIIQNHLLQILGIVTMDRPEQLNSQQIHAQKQAALERVLPVPANEVVQRAVRGQYEGYRQDVENLDSATETFASLTVYIDSPRWQGVPVTLVTGKGLDKRQAEICVTFQGEHDAVDNQLRFRIQPNEGFELDLATKKPGYDNEMQITPMNFAYQQEFAGQTLPNAYEKVLIDALRGDRTLFATSQEVLASWRVVQPVLDAWSRSAEDLKIYAKGSAGPDTVRSHS